MELKGMNLAVHEKRIDGAELLQKHADSTNIYGSFGSKRGCRKYDPSLI